MFNEIEDKVTSLIGFVYEIEEKGWVRGLGISTGDDDYLIEMNDLGEKLRNEIETDIEATGRITIDPHGKKRITVTDYKILYKDGDYNFFRDTNGNEDF